MHKSAFGFLLHLQVAVRYLKFKTDPVGANKILEQARAKVARLSYTKNTKSEGRGKGGDPSALYKHSNRLTLYGLMRQEGQGYHPGLLFVSASKLHDVLKNQPRKSSSSYTL